MTALSGALRADGVATGNIKSFGLKGTASGENIVARGNTIGKFSAQYDWTNALSPQSRVDIDAGASKVVAAGFALDSLHTKLTYHKPNGTAEVTVVQNDKDIYSANADFLLDKAGNELKLNKMNLRFDSTVWASTQPSLIKGGTAGIDSPQLELRNAKNGRLYVNGLIPKAGNASLEVAVDNLEVADLIALAQSDIQARGLLSFDLKGLGTATNPTFSGSFGTQDFYYNNVLIPEVHGTLTYANQTLTGHADAMQAGGRSLLSAQGTVPINLAFSGVTGSRFPSDRQIDLAIKADSLPLDLVPQFDQYVTGLKGKTVADFKVGGTLSHPEVTGHFQLDSAQAH
ncbi:MAG: hypothetical protein ACRD3J_18090, partial [Thermoanaerobaculia bacterium]